MKQKMEPTVLSVVSSTPLSASYQRVVFRPQDPARFPPNSAGDYFKLMFSSQGLPLERAEQAAEGKLFLRTYTIRHVDPNTHDLTVDFVNHRAESENQTDAADLISLASRWALDARPGDTILVRGPAPIQGIDTQADFLLYVADMTALPALSVKLANLADDAVGLALVQVADKADIQTLVKPAGIEVRWLAGDATMPLLEQAVLALPVPSTHSAVWCACEFGQMRTIRRHITDQWQTSRESRYFSSYWKAGVTEDGHKILKQQDTVEFNQQ
uniref:siderophore-interacting protein n=1 Tax=Thaumasiovibrio occultus TaxID=1891184 RepID=UPI000B360BD2|nr:siderophore-interacting protein [Thaumasiovibrio occultus]